MKPGQPQNAQRQEGSADLDKKEQLLHFLPGAPPPAAGNPKPSLEGACCWREGRRRGVQSETNKLCRAVEARRLIGNMPASLVPFRSHWNTVPSQSQGRDWNVPGSRATEKLLPPGHLGLDEYRRSPGGNPKGFLPPVSFTFFPECLLLGAERYSLSLPHSVASASPEWNWARPPFSHC